MSITPKESFIDRVVCLMCQRCSRKRRVMERLNQELQNNDFDFEKDSKVAKIIAEEL